MNQTTESLHELVEISRDGFSFYAHAYKEVTDPEVKAACWQMAELRKNLIRDLSAAIHAEEERPPGCGTLPGIMQKLYAELCASFSSESDGVYVSQLEEAEDRLLAAFERALLTELPPAADPLIRNYIPLARAAHEVMRNLKKRKGA